LTILGALVPDMIKSGFITAPQVAVVGSSTLVGLLIGCVGQGEFTDRFGRKAVYQFNLLLPSRRSPPPFPRISYGLQRFVSSAELGSVPSSRYAFRTRPNTRPRTFAAASSR
jgi:MFS family permease